MPAQRKRKAPELEATAELGAESLLSGIDGDCTEGNGSGRLKRKKVREQVSKTPKPQRERGAPPKPQQPTTGARGKANAINTTRADADALAQQPSQIVVGAQPQSVNTPVEQEYRAARWRKHPPIAVAERMERCMVQRMFVIGREPVEGSDPPEEKFMMAGTTGNIYNIHINNKPNCGCSYSGCHSG